MLMQASGNLARILAFVLSWSMLATVSIFSIPREIRQVQAGPAPLLAGALPAQVFADFDGDRLLDRAELISHGFQKIIRLTLSSRPAPNLDFYAEFLQPGKIFVEDIDRDSDDDLIWISAERPIHAVLWLNNGIGELARVSEPEAYAAYASAFTRLTAGESRNGILISRGTGCLRAIVANGFSLPALQGDHLPEAPRSVSTPASRHDCTKGLVASLPPYPKRGPPSFLPKQTATSQEY